MASDPVLDLKTLLRPISEDNPTGRDLREDVSPDSVYYRIKDARNAARTAERQAAYSDDEEEGAGPSSRPDWKPVLSLGQEVLAEQSKDLEVAVYLIEALVREHGFAGLRDGLRLVREMVESYWDALFPKAEDPEGMKDRVAGLDGLNAALAVPLRNVPVTQGGEFGPFTLADYQQANELDGLDGARKSQRIERGMVSMEMFERSVRATQPKFFQDVLDDLKECGAEFDRVGELLEEKCGTDPDGNPLAPSSSAMRESLEECHRLVAAISRAVLPPEPGPDPRPGPGPDPPPGTGPPGPIRTRDEAFRMLREVADFFRKTEPHSPIPYAVDQAVRWGRLPLPELLTELIADESTREQMFKLVGIRPPGDAGDTSS